MKPSPETLRYHEIRFWSVVLGTDAARIWIFDEHGDEHFALVPMNGGGKHNRWTREQALQAIASHIRSGLPAGEVKVNLQKESVYG